MANYIPNIDQFLNEIDPEKTIDRKQAMADITSVVLLKALSQIHGSLVQEDQNKIKSFAESKDEKAFERIYEVLEKAGKKEDFINAINENINEVRADYMKTHLTAMPEERREKILAKFPSLNTLLID